MTWTTVCERQDIPEGSGKEFVVEGRIVAVYRVADTFFALDGICPHAGGPLAQGMLRQHLVTCPWHGWQFDVRTGCHRLNPRVRAEGFAVQVVGDAVQIDVSQPPSTDVPGTAPVAS
jgi:nitrite reductase (NADH) small subunit